MRKLIVFGGNSERNKAWGEAVVERFGDWFDEVYFQHYDHWTNGEEVIDFDRKVAKLGEVISKGEPGVEYFILAKSYGSILSMRSVVDGVVSPAKCVFFGIPLNMVEEHNVWQGSWDNLGAFSVPTIAFHNADDPVASYSFLTTKLEEVGQNSIKVIKKDGDNHSYSELDQYESEIKEFLNV